ncbi:hypothetical protein [Natranaeroarchaeum sulfidigenes]|uniref:NosD-like cell surface protein n=1 Tax=Natranaeroarchaeum sulfidigenes TaxID=2784880 RepID=A0A897MK94_9EURY|nr:hypothetical protein [Natranaeroarchaeum sulfidigenes]QSG02530.1 NosD-like cell surface protein [Natranaeroarchaeum sulfidigenes]
MKIVLVVVGVLLAFSAPFVVGAVTDFYTVTEEAHYDATDGPEIELGHDIETNVQQPFPDANTVDLSPHGTISSTGPTYARVDQIDGDWTHLSQIDTNGNQMTIDPGDKQSVSVSGDITELEFRDMDPDSDTTDFVYAGPDDGSTEMTIEDLPSDRTILLVDQETGELLTWETTDDDGSLSVTLPHSEHSVTLQSSEGPPRVSNPDPDDGSEIADRTTTLSADVEDPDGTTTEVEISHNGDQIHTETIDGSGRVEAEVEDIPPGENEWTVTATDTTGQTTSTTYEFGVPDTLELRDESDPDSLITDEVTVTFFADDGEVATRTTTDGEIDLTGLPVNQRLIVVAESEEFHNRQMILDSLAQQQEMYLLPETADSVDILFTLDDETGNFDSDETELIIEKPIERDGDSRYRIVAADQFGVSGYQTTLEQGDRYRLTIRNADGDERVLGHHTAEETQTVPLSVGTLTWDIGDSIGEEERLTWEAKYIDDEEEKEYIRFQLTDLAEDTEDVNVVIHEHGDEENTIYDQTHRGPYGNLTITEPLTDEQTNTTWSVTWTADRDDEEVGASTIVGQGRYPVGLPMGDDWVSMFAGGLLVFVAGFFSVGTARIGAVIVPAVALGLWAVGWLPLPLPWILGALAVGVMARMAAGGGITQ